MNINKNHATEKIKDNSSNNMVFINKLNFSFNFGPKKLEVLRNLSLNITKGKIISILGPSGCGKTTLLKLTSGLLNGFQGEILINGQSPIESQRERKIGFIFQSPILFGWRTVKKNILLPLEIIKKTLTEKDLELASHYITLLGLKGFGNYYPDQLSGGMKSRVAIARTLIVSPKIILMDEPFSNLDEWTRTRLNIELSQIWRDSFTTILFVTHSIHEAILISDQILVLSDRPSSVIDIIDIEFENPRTPNILARSSYNEYYKRIQNMLGVRY